MAKTRAEQTVMDLVLSLVVLLGGAVAVVALLPRHHHEAVTSVDTRQPVRSFAHEAAYQPYVPSGLPAFWKPTSVRAVVPTGDDSSSAGGGPTGAGGSPVASLTIGYVLDRSSDNRTFARFDQSNETNATGSLLPEGSRVVGSVSLPDGDGGPSLWQVRRAGGHVALTRMAGGVTLIVSDGGGKGGASESDLTVLAAALRPAP